MPRRSRIVDNDLPGAVRFSAATFTVAEAMAAATITVQRTAGATASAVTVDYATVAGGTATAGADYLTTSGTLTFNAGETSKTFTVPILNDTLDEPGETLNLALSNPTGGATLGTPSTAILTITDNDVAGIHHLRRAHLHGGGDRRPRADRGEPHGRRPAA